MPIHLEINVSSDKNFRKEFVVVDSGVEVVREVTPKKINETSETYEMDWHGALNAEEDGVVAKIVVEKFLVTYCVELESASLVEIEAWTTIEGKNIFGLVLWSLTAKGLFGVYQDNAVLWVVDESSAWANGLLGWCYENFSHYGKINLNGLFGMVKAECDLYGPFWQSVHAWAWVRVWYNGDVDGNAGT